MEPLARFRLGVQNLNLGRWYKVLLCCGWGGRGGGGGAKREETFRCRGGGVGKWFARGGWAGLFAPKFYFNQVV